MLFNKFIKIILFFAKLLNLKSIYDIISLYCKNERERFINGVFGYI